MNTLPTTYTSKSITYTQINDGPILIYSCVGLNRKEWFELYVPVFVPTFKIAGKEITEHYRLPKDEDFGTCAWTYNTRKEAEKNYKSWF